MNIFKKIKLTYRYYKSLRQPKTPPKTKSAEIRPDVFAFLTSPHPVLPSEKKNCTPSGKFK